MYTYHYYNTSIYSYHYYKTCTPTTITIQIMYTYHYYNTKYIPVQLGTESINAYFKGTVFRDVSMCTF
jgi:hypothetical protein